MAKRATKKKTASTQQGGKMPWVVDPKKAYEVTRDMIRAVKNTDMTKAKRQYSSMRAAWQAHKATGGKQLWLQYARSQGFIAKKASLM